MSYLHVVIPVYNAKQFLQETVASVLDQPYKGIDIVLVDDGSTDGSTFLCDQIAQKEERVTVIHQKNAGVSAARNVGIEHFLHSGAQGYLAFLDADDLWCPRTFTENVVVNMMETGADMLGFSAFCSNPQASKVRTLSCYKSETRVFDDKYQTELLWAKGHFGAHLYSLRLLEENPIRFVVGCRLNEDVIFSAKALFSSQIIVFMDRYLYIYRKNRGSVTSRNVYGLDNAQHIPDAWYEAMTFADQCAGISQEACNKWKEFCFDTSAVRCLEVMRTLAENGYSADEIERAFDDRPYWGHITNLKVEKLAAWQQPDLVQYQNDRAAFFTNRAKKGTCWRYIKGIPFIYQMKEIWDNRKYKIGLKDINRESQ